MGQNIVSKISAATVMQQRNPPEKGTTEWWYRVAGNATGYEKDTSTFGEYTSLQGEFIARRLSDGETFVSNVCFIPSGVAEMIASRMVDAVDSTVKIPVLFDIGVKYSERSNTKYEYIVRYPGTEDQNAALSNLLESAPLPQQRQLPQ